MKRFAGYILLVVLLFFLCGCGKMTFREMTAAADYQGGFDAYRDKKYEKAREKFLKATENGLSEEYMVNAYSYIGHCSLELGERNKAASYYETALAIAPAEKKAMCYTNIGILLRIQKDYERAEEAYKNALEAEPDYIPALRSLGILYILNGRGEEAVTTLLRAKELFGGKSAEVLAELSYAYAVEGDRQNAETALNDALLAGYSSEDAGPIRSYINQMTGTIATPEEETEPSFEDTGELPKDTQPTKVPEPTNVPEASEEPIKRFLVAIDPGHQKKGNYDQEPVGPSATEMKTKVSTGTQGRISRVPEHQFNLELSLILRDMLTEKGYDVVMTRETADVNISNMERAQVANEANADIFVRIHADGADNVNAQGISVLYPSPNNPYISYLSADSKRLAEAVSNRVCESTDAKNRGIVKRDDLTGTNFAKMPVIVVESGYMTNEEEEAKLITREYKLLLAEGITAGIQEYFDAEN